MKNIALCLFALSLMSCGVVNTGYRGVQTRFGEVISKSLPEGLYFYNPITTKLVQLDVRTKKYENITSAYSKDAQVVDVTSNLNFNLEANKVHTVYKDVGVNWAGVYVKQILEGTVKVVVGQYKAVDLIANRAKVVEEISRSLKEKLAEKDIISSNFEMNNLDFDDAFELAVKGKVIAVEQAKEAKNKTLRIEEEARQRVISAQAEAKSMTIRSEALSKNRSLVEYEAVQKWDGKLPVYMLGKGTTPFINLNRKQ
jgi:prohibitin 2